MVYSIDRANSLAYELERFTTSYAHHVAGQFANLDFWLQEAVIALDVIEGYNDRFQRMSNAQQDWIGAHNTVIGEYCGYCEGKCEFETELTKPRPPEKISSSKRNEACRRLRNAAYNFLLRCYRMQLLDEEALRAACKRVGTSVEPVDLERKRKRPSEG